MMHCGMVYLCQPLSWWDNNAASCSSCFVGTNNIGWRLSKPPNHPSSDRPHVDKSLTDICVTANHQGGCRLPNLKDKEWLLQSKYLHHREESVQKDGTLEQDTLLPDPAALVATVQPTTCMILSNVAKSITSAFGAPWWCGPKCTAGPCLLPRMWMACWEQGGGNPNAFNCTLRVIVAGDWGINKFVVVAVVLVWSTSCCPDPCHVNAGNCGAAAVLSIGSRRRSLENSEESSQPREVMPVL